LFIDRHIEDFFAGKTALFPPQDKHSEDFDVHRRMFVFSFLIRFPSLNRQSLFCLLMLLEKA